jgi:cytochrome c-type biogenesis protein CcmH
MLRQPRRSIPAIGAVLVALVLAGAFVLADGPGDAGAQDPEAQALQIEKQLLCPQCTNKRLDVCELPICDDMRTLIRERLAAGDAPGDIILFFSNRYGDRVLADLPKSGFNLVLFGWVGGSIVFVALVGALSLQRMRRSAQPAVAGLERGDDQWLDEQLDDSDERPPGPPFDGAR